MVAFNYCSRIDIELTLPLLPDFRAQLVDTLDQNEDVHIEKQQYACIELDTAMPMPGHFQ
jgi:hypothetical protein